MSKKWDDEIVKNIFELSHRKNYSQAKIAYITGVPPRTVSSILNHPENIENHSSLMLLQDASFADAGDDPLTNQELMGENLKLARKIQVLQDTNRVERKSFREHGRLDNVSDALHVAIHETLKKNKFTTNTKFVKQRDEKAPVGVLQLSDLHFNELISDVQGNKFDFKVASQRLQKYVHKAKKYFNAHGVTHVAVMFCGDLLNSDRRKDEIVNAATNRSQAVFLAVDILQQLLKDLLEDYVVTVASITGNESRVGEFVEWGRMLAGDSYDLVIHNILQKLFEDDKRIKFIPIEDPLECVVNVNGTNILLVHGNGHKGVSRDASIEGGTSHLIAKYATRGIQIHYMLCGHIHKTNISDFYSRNSGLPGTNAYADKALNLIGKSAQNIHLVWKNGDLDSAKIDLQKTDGFEGYPFNRTLEVYHRGANPTPNVLIQAVMV